MIITMAAAALAAHLGAAATGDTNSVRQVQYCGNGYDIDIHGRCYPNGVIPPAISGCAPRLRLLSAASVLLQRRVPATLATPLLSRLN